MKSVRLTFTTQGHTVDDLWNLVRDVDTYPARIKYCKKVLSVDFKHGGSYTDVTTLLWIPATIRHTIESVQYPHRIEYVMALPGGGTSRQSYGFSHANGTTVCEIKVTFDLGHPLIDRTVGYVLSRRLVSMLKSGLPVVEPEIIYAEL
jgi:hypothetical protein